MQYYWLLLLYDIFLWLYSSSIDTGDIFIGAPGAATALKKEAGDNKNTEPWAKDLYVCTINNMHSSMDTAGYWLAQPVQ